MVLITLLGCSSWMHGYTKSKSFNRYLLVDIEAENLGYKRMEYIQGFREPIEKFVQKNGLPDFIYEFETKDEREGIRMYYVKQNRAYIFVEENWRPSSIFLSEKRRLTPYEKATYRELRKSSAQ
jgi:hypothetical protein